MRTRFLLGPAGSGKTRQCLEEIRADLSRSPEGLPLLFLAPKQATFQLERQLLADSRLPGYTRLQILSFDRLADFLVTEFAAAPARLLADEGRLMVLRALLEQRRSELRLFHASARLPGFAQQLNLLLREAQRHQLSPEKFLAVAEMTDATPGLADKLRDIALLLRAYTGWLKQNQLRDADSLLDLATELIQARARNATGTKSPLAFGGLWLDGFAEMTPQEEDLLAALVPFCGSATLAFCLERNSVPPPRLSAWAAIHRTFQNCLSRLEQLPGCDIAVIDLPRLAGTGRFGDNTVLKHLEQAWHCPEPLRVESNALSRSLRVVACSNSDAEAQFAAREILRFVRSDPVRRFRDVAVLVRSLTGYADPLRRAFTRYDIPFFLDQREPVAHHPLAELTRYALRTVAFGWQTEDWFGALKSGLADADEEAIDQLENEALERGWKGSLWLAPLQIAGKPELENHLEQLRRRLVPPFEALSQRLAIRTMERKHFPTGQELAVALRDFWEALDIPGQLDQWSGATENPDHGSVPAVHQTVWRQMQEWLDNLALAFPGESLPLREWLPILEAGLSGLTVGVIPPALDQVLVGAVDRSRNPDLRLVFVLGVNESIFPAPPAPPALLTETDRESIAQHGLRLGPDRFEQIGRERFFGYIAGTRAREQVVFTHARQDADGQPLNPSMFIGHLRQLFPNLQIENDAGLGHWTEAEHPGELFAPLLKAGGDGSLPVLEALEKIPELQPLYKSLPRLASLAELSRPQSPALSPVLAEQLYGPGVFHTSVSRLEEFAACPFKFFVHSGLRAEERKVFELDARERGTFQHEVLARFHETVRAEGKRWRDLSVPEARERIARIAGELTAGFRDGLLQAEDRNRFTAQSLTAALQDFIAASIEWMQQYQFDPAAVELAFGQPDDRLPAWKLDLGDGHQMAFRGKIDRVDVAAISLDSQMCVVMDYKSGAKKVDPLLLQHGIQLQLPAYLAALRHLPDAAANFGARQLVPAGFFYLNLRGNFARGENRREVLDDTGAAQAAYRHAGRFDFAALPQLDAAFAHGGSGQFVYKLTQQGKPNRRFKDLMEPVEFTALLDAVELAIRQMGRRIFAGDSAVDPFCKGLVTACDQCEFQPICRIDAWTHSWRVLKKSAEAGNE